MVHSWFSASLVFPSPYTYLTWKPLAGLLLPLFLLMGWLVHLSAISSSACSVFQPGPSILLELGFVWIALFLPCSCVCAPVPVPFPASACSIPVPRFIQRPASVSDQPRKCFHILTCCNVWIYLLLGHSLVMSRSSNLALTLALP